MLIGDGLRILTDTWYTYIVSDAIATLEDSVLYFNLTKGLIQTQTLNMDLVEVMKKLNIVIDFSVAKQL